MAFNINLTVSDTPFKAEQPLMKPYFSFISLSQ